MWIFVFFVRLFIVEYVFFFAMLPELDARIVRSSCMTFGNFSYIMINSLQQGSVIASHDYLTELECKGECIYNAQCKSINFHINGTCQINDKSAADATDNSTLAAMQDWKFLSTNYTERLLGVHCKKYDPCGKYFLCKDSCHCPGYVCIPCALARGINCQKTFIIKHHESGLCISRGESSNYLMLNTFCTEKFVFTSTNALKHVKSGKCAVPVSKGPLPEISLSSNCDDLNARFEQTTIYPSKQRNALKHISTGRCVQRYHYWILIVDQGCTNHLSAFNFIYDEN